MRLSIISFTENGKRLSEHIADLLQKKIEILLFTKCEACRKNSAVSPVLFVEKSLGDWAKEQMQEKNTLLFIGACGIAVRAIAPSLTDKLHDVPVLVMDERGRYVIPILSGHVGGANEWAGYLAGETGAEPVITTATDINKKFAVDLFAKRNNLFIENKDGIVKVSSKVLAGETITISIEPGHGADGTGKCCLPSGIRLAPYPPEVPVDVVVTSKEDKFDASLVLRPREYVIGLGCKKGKAAEEIKAFITRKMEELGITAAQVYAVASISLKSGEQGIVSWCDKEGIPFLTYTAKELQEVKGNFTGSSFVREKTGVDNVCERAALKACGDKGTLLTPKYAENGMTIAVAKREWKVCVDEK
ncbi:MAG: hypothetical protein HDR24_09735 [Lachnospiraceae bacterium]|nr:hypothetical protein [Lachnospiraceae bacterium]